MKVYFRIDSKTVHSFRGQPAAIPRTGDPSSISIWWRYHSI